MIIGLCLREIKERNGERDSVLSLAYKDTCNIAVQKPLEWKRNIVLMAGKLLHGNTVSDLFDKQKRNDFCDGISTINTVLDNLGVSWEVLYNVKK